MSSAHPRGAAAQTARRNRRLKQRRLLSLENLETRRVFAPVVTSLAATSINEGGTSVLTVDFSDPQLLNNTYRLQVDWGDGAGLATIPVPAANITVIDAATGAMRTTVSKPFADDNPTGTPVDTFTIRAAMFDQTEVSLWKFDEAAGTTAFDYFGINNGVLQGTPLPARVPGLVGTGALSYPGTNGVTVNVGSNASLAATDGFAIEALIRPTWTGVGNALIYRKEDAGNRILFGFQQEASGPVLTIGINTNGYSEVELPLNVNLAGNPNGVAGAGTIYLDSPGIPVGANDVILKDGNTHHVVASYDAATGETALWVDGVKRYHVFDAAGTPMLSGGGAPGHIGSNEGSGEPYAGVLDEVAFYNRSVSPALVADHAARGNAGLDYFFKTTTFTVTNSLPVVSAGGDATVFEGLFTRSGTITDGVDTFTGATVNYGDGTGVQPLVLVGNTFQLSHNYADNGVYTVTVNVTDDDTGVVTTSFVLNVLNDIPVVGTPPAGQATTEGSLYAFTLNFVDFGTADTHQYSINWGDGSPNSTGNALAATVSGTHVYADDGPNAGTYTVTVTVTDDDGGAGSSAFLVTVGNALPTISPVVNVDGEEGVPFLLSALFNDRGTLDSHTATINWGDGTPTSPPAPVTETTFGPPGSVAGLNGTINRTHTYANDGTYPVVITLTDDNGGVATRTVSVTIADALPIVTIVGPDGDTTVRGLPTEFTFFATDVPADANGGYTFVIDWGDGSPEEEVFSDEVDPDTGEVFVTLTHVFQVEGLKSITAVAIGEDGVASDAAGLDITVTVVGVTIDENGFTNAVVGGSIYADRIVLSLLYNGNIQARINNKNYVVPDADGKIIIYGQDGGDTISVANNVNYDVDMYGQGGNDYLAGGIFNDMLDGGIGSDRLLGGNGNNIYYGGDGNDVITGGGMSEIAYGGAGIDSIDGKGGHDVLDGGDGNDRIIGGLGNDLIRGGAGSDVIRGDSGHDILIGGDGNDSMYGYGGRDILVGGRGADQMYGGIDDDILIHASTEYDENDIFFDEIWLSIMAAWLQPGTVQDRIDEIGQLPFGLDEGVIPNDNVRDSLYGEADYDWFLVALNDTVSGFREGDVKTVLYI